MQINMKENVEKRRNTGANRTLTRGIGYTRESYTQKMTVKMRQKCKLFAYFIKKQ